MADRFLMQCRFRFDFSMFVSKGWELFEKFTIIGRWNLLSITQVLVRSFCFTLIGCISSLNFGVTFWQVFCFEYTSYPSNGQIKLHLSFWWFFLNIYFGGSLRVTLEVPFGFLPQIFRETHSCPSVAILILGQSLRTRLLVPIHAQKELPLWNFYNIYFNFLASF